MPSPSLFEDTSRLGRPYAKDPSVIYFHEAYWLFYSLPPSEIADNDERKNVWGIGIACSRDLASWKKVGELLPEQEIEKNGICAPGARVLNDRVHLFYQTYGNGPKDAICHAVSDDGIHFTRNASNPVFRPLGNWSSGRAIDAEVFPFEGKLFLYYATRDPEMKIQMLGVAVASLSSSYDASAWHDLSLDSPILKPELPWEQCCIEAPTVCQHKGKLYMFYAGAYNNAPQQIGVAVSSDGVSWERMSARPFLKNGAAGTWNSCESGHPGVSIDEDGRTHLFYQGNSDGGKTWVISWRRLTWDDGNPLLD